MIELRGMEGDNVYCSVRSRIRTSETVVYRCTHGPDQSSDGWWLGKDPIRIGTVATDRVKVRVNNTCSYRESVYFLRHLWRFLFPYFHIRWTVGPNSMLCTEYSEYRILVMKRVEDPNVSWVAFSPAIVDEDYMAGCAFPQATFASWSVWLYRSTCFCERITH